MIYELFVRKSFIRSSVYKIIIFAISFIHTEYEHVNKHRTECAAKQRQQQLSCKSRISLLLYIFFFGGIYIFSAQGASAFLRDRERERIEKNDTLFAIRMNAIVMSSERCSLPADGWWALFCRCSNLFWLNGLACSPSMQTKPI